MSLSLIRKLGTISELRFATFCQFPLGHTVRLAGPYRAMRYAIPCTWWWTLGHPVQSDVFDSKFEDRLRLPSSDLFGYFLKRFDEFITPHFMRMPFPADLDGWIVVQ